jgi:hypothetical protein
VRVGEWTRGGDVDRIAQRSSALSERSCTRADSSSASGKCCGTNTDRCEELRTIARAYRRSARTKSDRRLMCRATAGRAPLMPQTSENESAQPCGKRPSGGPQTRMVACVSGRPLPLVVAVGTACHAEGRGFESLHPLLKPPEIGGFCLENWRRESPMWPKNHRESGDSRPPHAHADGGRCRSDFPRRPT